MEPDRLGLNSVKSFISYMIFRTELSTLCVNFIIRKISCWEIKCINSCSNCSWYSSTVKFLLLVVILVKVSKLGTWLYVFVFVIIKKGLRPETGGVQVAKRSGLREVSHDYL